jgi:hypothetical protein
MKVINLSTGVETKIEKMKNQVKLLEMIEDYLKFEEDSVFNLREINEKSIFSFISSQFKNQNDSLFRIEFQDN